MTNTNETAGTDLSNPEAATAFLRDYYSNSVGGMVAATGGRSCASCRYKRNDDARGERCGHPDVALVNVRVLLPTVRTCSDWRE